MIVRTSPAVPPGVSLTEDEVTDAFGPEGATVTDTVTVPLKPFKLERVRVTVPDTVRGTVIEDVLATSEKSGANRTMTRTIVEWDREVELPAMVIV